MVIIIQTLVLVLMFNMNEAILDIPKDHCVLPWDVFVNKVVDKDWIGIHHINDDDSVNSAHVGVASKARFHWSSTTDPDVLDTSANGWVGQCFKVPGLFTRQSTLNPTQPLAIMTGAADPFGFVTPETVHRVLSDDPDNYAIFNMCFSTPTANGKCEDSLTYVIIPDLRTTTDGVGHQIGDVDLSGIPWDKVAKQTESCLGKTFSDQTSPVLEYSWLGPECRESSQVHCEAEDQTCV